MKELRIPELDSSGRLIRRLTAASATGSFDLLKLVNGAVEFYPLQSLDALTLGTLDFDDALFHRSIGVINSGGRVHFISSQGELAGIGYRYELTQGRLVLNSSIVLNLPMAHITGNQAEANLVQPSSARDFIISDATISGGVIVTGINSEKYKFDRAETASATYTGNDDVLTLASPVTLWSKGQKSVIEAQEIKINIERPNQLPHPVPAGENGSQQR